MRYICTQHTPYVHNFLFSYYYKILNYLAYIVRDDRNVLLKLNKPHIYVRCALFILDKSIHCGSAHKFIFQTTQTKQCANAFRQFRENMWRVCQGYGIFEEVPSIFLVWFRNDEQIKSSLRTMLQNVKILVTSLLVESFNSRRCIMTG